MCPPALFWGSQNHHTLHTHTHTHTLTIYLWDVIRPLLDVANFDPLNAKLSTARDLLFSSVAILPRSWFWEDWNELLVPIFFNKTLLNDSDILPGWPQRKSTRRRRRSWENLTTQWKVCQEFVTCFQLEVQITEQAVRWHFGQAPGYLCQMH